MKLDTFLQSEFHQYKAFKRRDKYWCLETNPRAIAALHSSLRHVRQQQIFPTGQEIGGSIIQIVAWEDADPCRGAC